MVEGILKDRMIKGVESQGKSAFPIMSLKRTNSSIGRMK
jgi:hypothetical protein